MPDLRDLADYQGLSAFWRVFDERFRNSTAIQLRCRLRAPGARKPYLYRHDSLTASGPVTPPLRDVIAAMPEVIQGESTDVDVRGKRVGRALLRA